MAAPLLSPFEHSRQECHRLKGEVPEDGEHGPLDLRPDPRARRFPIAGDIEYAGGLRLDPGRQVRGSGEAVDHQ